MRRLLKLAAPMLAATLALGACGGQVSAPTPAPTTAPGGAKAGFPMTVKNCGREVTLTKQPQRVLAIGDLAVVNIYTAGGVGSLIGRQDESTFPYAPEIKEALQAVPRFGGDDELSKEAVIAIQPDLVIGYPSSTVNPEALGDVGIPMFIESGYCGTGHGSGTGISDGASGLEHVFGDLALYGRIFGTADKATASLADLQKRVDAVKRRSQDAERRSAATLEVYQGKLSVYGSNSMPHAQLEILGLTNVFGESKDFYFETNPETLIARNPDALVLLTYGKTAEQAKTDLLGVSGLTKLKAVQNDNIVIQPWYYSGTGVTAVDGLENMANKLLPTK